MAQPSGGSFDPGVYRVFNYAGALSGSGLTLGSTPAGSGPFFVQTSVPEEVNLVNAAGLTLNFWDGAAPANKDNSRVDGGNGVWQNNLGNDNWTNVTGTVNAPFSNGSFAIFEAQPGTVTVNSSLGLVAVVGMQFASNGYVVQGNSITLLGPNSIINVGDGATDGAGYTATIDSVLTRASW